MSCRIYSGKARHGHTVGYLRSRWEKLPGDDRAASFLLADLLDAQDRLVLEEIGFASAQVDYTMSFVRLNRATGTLLNYERIELIRSCQDCLPTIQFDKPGIGTDLLPTPAR